jgi:hypothetical protein
MHPKRSLSVTIAASLVLLLGVPAVASANPVPVAASAAAAPGDDIELADAALVDAPQIELDGEILVTIAEPAPGAIDEVLDHQDDLTTYSVVTDGGDAVQISGDIPTGVASGDRFTGSVAVPQSVTDALPSTSADEVARSDAARPVDGLSAAATDVLETAVEQDTELAVARAVVVPEPLASAGTAMAHTLSIVVINPDGVAASTVGNDTIGTIAAQSTGFWSSASGGRIPAFTPDATITRASSAVACNSNSTARWNEAAGILGYSSASAFRNAAPSGTKRHLMVVLPTGCQSASGIGIASVGRDLHEGGFVQVVLGAGVDRQVVTHELGHNLSLGHANLDYCDTAGCGEYEYMDVYDVMGVSYGGFDAGVTALNARNQVALGFTTVAAANVYTLPDGSSSRSATVTLGRINGTDAPRVLQVVDPLTSDTYYIEYRGGEAPSLYSGRRSIAIDSGRTLTAAPGVRLLRTSGVGSSALTVADSAAGRNRAFAEPGKPIQNPSGSVVVTVGSMSEASGASITITLNRNAPQPVYRFWSPANNTHFYTMSVQERDSIRATYPESTWTYEGERYKAFGAKLAGTVPLYRFWSPRLKGHFFTTNEAEKNSVINDYDDATWTYEGIAYYVYPTDSTVANTLPVARFWSPTYQHHFYTASAEEARSVRAYPESIWTFEGDNYRVPVG